MIRTGLLLRSRPLLVCRAALSSTPCPAKKAAGWQAPADAKGGGNVLAQNPGFPSEKTVKWIRQWRYSKAKGVLVLDIEGSLADLRTVSPLERWSSTKPPAPALFSAISSLQKAAADPQVASVYLRIGGLACSMAQVEELRAAIRLCVVHKSVVGYVEAAAELEIAVGAACTELHVAPGGYTSLSGFAERYSLLRGLLAKVGVEPEVTQVTEPCLAATVNRALFALPNQRTDWTVSFAGGVLLRMTWPADR
jgi:hypothetical protein